jgi:hypothetical protein
MTSTSISSQMTPRSLTQTNDLFSSSRKSAQTTPGPNLSPVCLRTMSSILSLSFQQLLRNSSNGSATTTVICKALKVSRNHLANKLIARAEQTQGSRRAVAKGKGGSAAIDRLRLLRHSQIQVKAKSFSSPSRFRMRGIWAN